MAELKSEKGKLAQEQALWLKAFREAGLPAYLWRPSMWPEIEAVLKGGMWPHL